MRLASSQELFQGHPLDRREEILHSDRTLTLRPVLPGDVGGLDRLVREASETSRYRRFHGAVTRLTPRQMAGIIDVDHHGRETLVVLDGDRVIAFGQFIATAPGQAEIAVMVGDTWQGQGLGTLLVGRLAQAAQDEGYARLVATVLAENRPALQMLTRAAPQASFKPDGTTVEVEIPLGGIDLRPDGTTVEVEIPLGGIDLRPEGADVREVPVALGVVQAVPDHEDVGDREAVVTQGNGDPHLLRLAEQREHLERRRPPGTQVA